MAGETGPTSVTTPLLGGETKPPLQAPLFPAEESMTAGAAPEQAPIAGVIAVSPAVADNLKIIQKADTLDTYRRRINGTSALLTRVSASVTIPTGLLTVASEGVGFGLPTAIITGGSALVASLLAPAIVYGKQRLQEKGKAAQRNVHQEVVRDHLGGEPVDVIRHKGRKKHGSHVRWYGADTPKEVAADDQDTEKAAEQNDAAAVDRFAGIVAFADQYNLKSVVVSSKILQKIPQADAKKLTKQYEDNLTTTEQFFKDTKGIKLHDRNADDQLLQLTPKEAKKLLREMGHKGELPLDEAVADFLVELAPGHVAARAIKEWKQHGKNSAFRQEVVAELRATIERKLQRDQDQVVTRDYIEHYEEREKEPGKKEIIDLIIPVDKGMDTNLSLSKNGVQYFDSATLSDGEVSQSRTHGLSRLVGQDINAFAVELAKLSKQRDDAPAKDKWKYAADIDKVEIALYHQLQQAAQPKVPAKAKSIDSKTAKGSDKTLYQRLPEERPRTLVLPRVAKRGKVSKEDQTIEYGRKFWRNTAKKVGAVAVAAGLAYGAGNGLGESWAYSEVRAFTCDNQTTEELAHDPGHIEYCTDNPAKDIVTVLGKAGAGVYHASNKYENAVIQELFTSGILDVDTLMKLSGHVSKEWAAEKIKDLGQRYNLYNGSRSPTMNAVVSPNGDPTLWSLDPTGGAKTDGYWPSSIQDSIYIESDAPDEIHTPPLNKGSLEFTQQRDRIAPFGTKVRELFANDTNYIRELHLPTTPVPVSGPLIKVTGRQLLDSALTDLKFYDTGAGDFDSWLATDLPVQLGGDIVAARVVEKSLATDKVVLDGADLQNFYQQDDGTYHLRLPYHAAERDQNYADVTYWIKPHSSTALPLRIDRPLTISQKGEYGKPLSEVLRPEDVAKLREQLGIKPDATPEEAAKAISESRTYSLTPYPPESQNDRSVNLNADPTIPIEIPTGKVAVAIAEYAANLKSADCNVARTLEAVALRGVGVNGEFLGSVTGFGNDGDNRLLQTESHTYTRTNTGKDTDPVPHQVANPTEKPAPLDFQDTLQPHDNTLKTTLTIIGAISGFGTGIPIGAYSISNALAATRRRRERLAAERRQASYELALDYLPGNEPADAPLTEAEKQRKQTNFSIDLAILNHALYAPQDAVLDEAKLPDAVTASASASANRSWEARLKDLPFDAAAGPAPLQETLRLRTADGTLKISAGRLERLTAMVGHAFAIQNFTQAEDK